MKAKVFLSILFVIMISMAASCEGDSNKVDDNRDNIASSWHATLDDGAVPEEYEVAITKDDIDETKVKLSNFVNNGEENVAYAILTGFNLTVPEQTVGNATVSGDGTVTSDYQSISWNITIDGDSYTMDFVPGGITKVGL